MNIERLMRVPRAHHNIAWLKDSLQAAVELELATLPPYLTALWSIKNQTGKVFDLIRLVVFEEMLHMGLVCNLLTTTGGTPVMTTPQTVPRYPGPLPGGVRPGLTVSLTGLTRRLVKEVFMEIEYPQGGPVALARSMTYTTIGEFYTAIGDAFEAHPGAIKGTRQLSGPIAAPVFPINVIDDVRKAVKLIKEQGEGTSQSPLAVDFGGDLAHYYKFAEIYHGRELVKNAHGQWKYEGNPIPFPEVYPVAQVPADGYPDLPEAVAFDKAYTAVLRQLQEAWAGGDQNKLDAAINDMPGLANPARRLMTMPLDAGGYVYGPAFRLVP